MSVGLGEGRARTWKPSRDQIGIILGVASIVSIVCDSLLAVVAVVASAVVGVVVPAAVVIIIVIITAVLRTRWK